jgi:monoamine oxidase
MARTPLLSRLGAPVRVGRRAFLRGLGATAAALAAGGAPRTARGATPSVAIVGAGIAGLTAALVLRDRGLTPTVYEAATRIGGRMHSETAFWADAQTSEYCGELIDTDHLTIRTLARRFGLALDDVNAAAPPGSNSVQFFDDAYVPWSTLQREFAPVYRTLQAQLRAIDPPVSYARHTAAGALFDRMSIYAWIDRYVPGGHRSALGAFLDVAFLDEYGRDTRQQSALNMILWLGVQPDPNDFNRMGPSDERFHIRGGNQRLPEAIAAALPAGALVRGARLTAIRQLADGRVGLAFDGRASETIVDHAIVTIPFSVLRTLDTTGAGFTARKRLAIEELGYGANAKLVVQFAHRFWNGRGPWPGIGNGEVTTDLPFQSTWETSAAQPGASGLLTNYTGEAQRLFAPATAYASTASAADVDPYARRFARQFDRIMPGATGAYNGRAILSVPSADPLLAGAYSYWKPGQVTGFGGYERLRQGNIHFAGEHTSLHFQGFMEGGAQTGALAAHEVLA